MDVIPTRSTHDRRSTRRRPSVDARQDPPRADEQCCPSYQLLPGGLRVERRASGTSVSGPGFHVWDADHDTALRWAKQLASGLPIYRLRGSRPRTDR